MAALQPAAQESAQNAEGRSVNSDAGQQVFKKGADVYADLSNCYIKDIEG